jgi:Cof subfamily protein (haloacid dehalogenase superfamily)
MVKMIVSDLDGTLLRSDKTVSDRTVRVLKSIEDTGGRVAFATARPPRDAFRLIPDALKNDLVICYNGAIVYNDEEIVYSQELSLSTVREIFELAGRFGLNQISMEVRDVLHANFDVDCVFGPIPYEPVQLDSYDFASTHKVMIYDEGKIPAAFIDALPDACTAVVTDAGTLCQIVKRDVTKWNSIAHMLERLGLDHGSVVAFGDDYNDMEMIENAGVGVAMGNAVEALKSVADYVTATNDEDGIAAFIQARI